MLIEQRKTLYKKERDTEKSVSLSFYLDSSLFIRYLQF